MAERTSYVLPGIALILIGFATGWFLQGARQEARPTKPSSATPTKTARVDERLRIALDEITALNDPEARLHAIERIPPERMRAYLQALRNRAGLRGLNHRDQEVLSAMLAVWHSREPSDALTWILAHEDETSRVRLLYRLLDASDSIAPIDAVKLSVEHLVSADGRFEIPPSVLQTALDEGGDILLDCLEVAVHPGARSQLVELDFPADFDFAGLAQKFAKQIESLPEGTGQLVIPANLAEEWVGQEPALAFLWASHHPEAATQRGVQASISSIAESPPKQAGAIFAEAIAARGADSQLVLAGLNQVLHSEPNPQILTHFLASLETPGDQESHLASLFLTTIGPTQELRSSRVRHLVLSRMRAEERLTFLEELMSSRNPAPKPSATNDQVATAMRDELERLNHSPEEISAIMSYFAPAPPATLR